MNTLKVSNEGKVLIVGAPNVGKSTLFNRLIGKRKAIVLHEPGVTRDMIYGALTDGSFRCTIVDTGGLILGYRDTISKAVQMQIARALNSAAMVVFLADGRSGVTPLDEEIALFLLRSGMRVILCVNKIDLPTMEDFALPFYSLGLGEPMPISAENNRGLDSLIERIKNILQRTGELSSELMVGVPPASPAANGKEIRIVIAGRQNVGKSSLLNALIGDERMIVSEIPGTTTDSVDSILSYGGKRYIIVDTAGIRRKKRAQGDVEKIAVIKAKQNIKKCDIVILVLDCSHGITAQDAAIAGYAASHNKPVLVLLNKWDLVEDKNDAMNSFRDQIARRLSFIKNFPILRISALKGTGMHRILPEVDALYEKYSKVIPTTELNKLLSKTAKRSPLFSSHSSSTKLFYIVQAGIRPQKFIVFVRKSKDVPSNQRRFLENIIRDGFNLGGIPLMIEFRGKKESLQRISK